MRIASSCSAAMPGKNQQRMCFIHIRIGGMAEAYIVNTLIIATPHAHVKQKAAS
ncbi:hypothetical protein [Domibacillus tundrae]|uniref:hypothetical protein n=1 Tax=Domibacillus tundrae TaxID=1587527 RepID=UPI0012E0BB60|nr:hypothetical protein [Domibacillus tundrae]